MTRAEAAQRIADPDKVLTNNDVVLVGEMHGTKESPRFVLAAACLALKEGRGVTVALEIPHEEDPLLQQYLISPREPAGSGPAFIAGPFWQSPYKDGRSSKAMSDLIMELRRWRTDGYPIRLVTIDPSGPPASGSASALTGAERDSAMASILAAAIEGSPKDLFLVLTGNLHNRLERGTPWDRLYEPMGFLLAQRLSSEKRLLALDVHYYSGGRAWMCSAPGNGCGAAGCGESTCGTFELPKPSTSPPSREGAAIGVILEGAVAPNRYHGYYYFQSAVQASDPAVAPPASGKTSNGRVEAMGSRTATRLGGASWP